MPGGAVHVHDVGEGEQCRSPVWPGHGDLVERTPGLGRCVEFRALSLVQTDQREMVTFTGCEPGEVQAGQHTHAAEAAAVRGHR